MAFVMIIDDEPSIALVLKTVLADEGYEVITFTNSIAGLERLKQDPIPDILFVDLNMPAKSGKDVIEEINSVPRLRSISIVILSGSLPDKSILPPRGSYKYLLNKPFELQEIINIVAYLEKQLWAV